MARSRARGWMVGAVVAWALALVGAGVAGAQEICELRFIPPDGTREICYDCDSPPDSQAAAECEARCSDPAFRRANPECAFRDGDRCASDEERVNGVCVRKCEDDERRVGARCELLECPMGQRPSRGECVPVKPRRMAKMQAPQCITPDELKQVEALTEAAETLTERRGLNIIALAIVRFSTVTLPDGRTVGLPPGDDSPEAKRLARTIDRFISDQGLRCEAEVMLSCIDPLTTICAEPEPSIRALYEQVFAIGNRIEALPQFDACVASGEPRLRRFIMASKRAVDSRNRFDSTNPIFNAVRNATNLIELSCSSPELEQCQIRTIPNPPFVPKVGFAGRKVKIPLP